MLFEAGIEVLLLILLLSGFQALLVVFGLVGGGVIIHDTHVMNTVSPLGSDVSDENIPLQISLVLQRGPFLIFPPLCERHNLCRFWGCHTRAWWLR